MILLRLDGRIGNQLFMYAFAKSISEKCNEPYIIIDDTEVLKQGYVNSLMEYALEHVEYVHNHKLLYSSDYFVQNSIFNLYRIIRKPLSFNNRFLLEKKCQPVFNKFGTILCENGYLEVDVNNKQNILINGYFQSEKYFTNVSKYIRDVFSLEGDKDVNNYHNIDKIRSRNTVCVSIKVQHNVDSPMYDVCHDGYWQKAMEYICENVDNPLFFICSDNVEYAIHNLIDCKKYDVVFQDTTAPVHISLAAMAQCKHFVIGNTSFGWWAQYLSKYDRKIVVAPSRWMKITMPMDIYQDTWHLVEV